MGSRSRKRSPSSGASQRAAPPAPAREPRRGERPPAPWHPFPLVELSVLVGIVLIVLGLVLRGERGRVALLFGLVLGSLGGLDTALREHFGGVRSHSALLAGVPAVLVGGGLAVARAPHLVVVVLVVATFLAAFGWARGTFRTRTQGQG